MISPTVSIGPINADSLNADQISATAVDVKITAPEGVEAEYVDAEASCTMISPIVSIGPINADSLNAGQTGPLADLLWGDELDAFLDPYCAALSRYSVGETIDEGAVIVGDAEKKVVCFFTEEHLGRDAIGFVCTLNSLAARRILRMVHDGEDGRFFKVLKRIPVPWVRSLADRWP